MKPSRRALRAAARRRKRGDLIVNRADNSGEVLHDHGWSEDQVAELRRAERVWKERRL